MLVGYISHESCVEHEMGEYHPEQPARLTSIRDRLIASGVDYLLDQHDAPLVERKHLVRVHDDAYVTRIFKSSPESGYFSLDADTVMNPHSLEAARRAAGAGVLGVDLLMSGRNKRVFCSVRPPGHHAERRRAMGFCLFNNIAVAAAYALQEHKLQRVAVVDFDVHHGNGTEDIFAGDERVLFCSSFQHPFYPHSGEGETASNVVNVPLPAATGGEAFRAAVQQHWLPALAAFEPELIFISAGFDGHRDDDMAQFSLTEQDFAWVTAAVVRQAEASAGGRVLSMLEGGYHLEALARSVTLHVKALMGEQLG